MCYKLKCGRSSLRFCNNLFGRYLLYICFERVYSGLYFINIWTFKIIIFIGKYSEIPESQKKIYKLIPNNCFLLETFNFSVQFMNLASHIILKFFLHDFPFNFMLTVNVNSLNHIANIYMYIFCALIHKQNLKISWKNFLKKF